MKPLLLFSYAVHSHSFRSLSQFVPKHKPVADIDVHLLKEFLTNLEKILVLTGAGISTESGIPDYRSEEVGLYARSNHRPTTHLEFIKSAAVRQRYWARNFVGWFTFSKRQPNNIHLALKDLEILHNKISAIVTQNVDGLHSKAGSQNVIELHGTAFRVLCLDCNASYSRFYVQEQLVKLNGEAAADVPKMVRPDGDVDIPEKIMTSFVPPVCDSCHGPLKPDITFFGDNVPKSRVDQVRNHVSKSDALLVLGSSLSVLSGYRIILQAVEENKSIGIVNIGPTRADNLVNLKIETKCGDLLPKVVRLFS